MLPTFHRRLVLTIASCCTLIGLLALTCSLVPPSPVYGQRIGWTNSKIAGTPEPPPPFRVETALNAVRFDRPVLLTAYPGRDLCVVAEQRGKIFSVSTADDSAPALFADFKSHDPQVTAIYGLAFHPDFADNRKVYITHVANQRKSDGTCVSEFVVRDGLEPVIEWESRRDLLRWKPGGHNGGCLKFGPDGLLYISTGDAAPASPPDGDRVGQDLTNLLSCVLRIDVDHPTDESPYSIPSDNPFRSEQGARPEIYAYGFRNPWKMSFDLKGNLWVGDVGWELWEMIYRVESGGNYGWSIMEGPQVVLPEQDPGPTPILPPTVYHPHSEAASITGGYVYRGKDHPDLVGTYIYGDYQSGIVWGFRWKDGKVQDHRVLARTSLRLVAFGEDNDGELYLIDHQGMAYQLASNEAEDRSQQFPRKLSETGLFSDTARHEMAQGIVPFEINARAWADGLHSLRWLAVPGTEAVQIDAKGNWQFPDGTVVVKTILDDPSSSSSLPYSDTSQGRRLETQILHREGQAWHPYTYVWNDDQTDGTLAPEDGTVLNLEKTGVESPNYSPENYRVAGRKECSLCHNSWVENRTTVFGTQSASLLGVHSKQLNRDLENGQRQLDELTERGLLSAGAADSSAQTPLVNPYDDSQDLNRRVRSYLHVNCAHCHQFNAGGVATIGLGHDLSLDKMKLLGVRPAQGTYNLQDPHIVSPGDPYSSVLLYRLATSGPGRMPRLGSRSVDRQAVEMVHDWIAQLGPADDSDSHRELDLLLQTALDASHNDHKLAVQELLASTRGALALATTTRLENNKVKDVRAMAARAATTSEIRGVLEPFLPLAERRKTLGDVYDYDELLAVVGEPARGRAMFFSAASSCKNCHQIGGQGVAMGPALDTIGKKYHNRRDLLKQILEPSAVIDPKYVPYLVETSDGEILNGLMEEKDDKRVVLRDAKNLQHAIPRDSIEVIVRQQKSIMPELLLRDMTKQEVADLLAFLTTLQP